mmetsp:Transcript_3585/g.6104  ORF Transcript_3585/g.6104 Transcript_3585/m.6104 type:complete len:247 (-) Transcript_3585:44-784(-)
MNLYRMYGTVIVWCFLVAVGQSFIVPLPRLQHQKRLCGAKARRRLTGLAMIYRQRYGRGKATQRRGQEKSKRQHRVSQLVQSELASIIHSGNLKGRYDYLDDDLRKRISIVRADVSPDLRQARITVSLRRGMTDEGLSSGGSTSHAVDQRRAYSWLVQNAKALRHTLAQRMSHMKASPDLSFDQVDVASAVDVMYLIDKVAAGYKREDIGPYGRDDDSVPRGMFGGFDFDEEDEDWEDEDFEFLDE